MAMHNPTGRANYEPNSWGKDGGPRETANGFHSYPEKISGEKLRIRAESFADHYSQARQFYLSQTPLEQQHIANALIFELSKVEKVAIRERTVSHLLNIDKALAKKVVTGLRLPVTPDRAKPAAPVNMSLKPSPALSIMLNSPNTFTGRKLGILLTDGADAKLFNALKTAVRKSKALLEIIAPEIGGVKLNDGTLLSANQNIEGGPSVLYDAVAILTSQTGVNALMNSSAARDFIADAFAHFKFIAYSKEVLPLLQKIGIGDDLDKGCILLKEKSTAEEFIKLCAQLRFWQRENV